MSCIARPSIVPPEASRRSCASEKWFSASAKSYASHAVQTFPPIPARSA